METSIIKHQPKVLLVHRFIKGLGGNTPRQTVRCVLEKFYHRSPITLFTLSQVLQSFEITPSAYKSNLTALKSLPLPFIAMIQDEKRSYLVIVEKAEKDVVEYYKTNAGLVVEPLESFTKKWNGVFLTAQLDDSKSISDYKDEELEAAEEYRKNFIKVIDDFLTKEECNYIINYTENKGLFKRSKVAGNESILVSSKRTSFSAYLDNRNNSVFKKICQKVTDFLNVSEYYMENLQVVRYTKDQEFTPHTDPKSENDRKYTILIYLNDEFEGGETYFPELDLKIIPKRGRMLCFLNRNEENHVIPFSTHAGLIIRNGIKYGCNIWVGNPIYFEKKQKLSYQSNL